MIAVIIYHDYVCKCALGVLDFEFIFVSMFGLIFFKINLLVPRAISAFPLGLATTYYLEYTVTGSNV